MTSSLNSSLDDTQSVTHSNILSNIGPNSLNAVSAIAGLEIKMGLRNKWVLAATLLMTLLALSIAALGSSPTGATGADPLTVTVVSLASLTIFLVPLMALLLSYDGIIGEIEQGTMLLMLSYPVSRSAVLCGKFLGQSAIIGFSTACGYGAAGFVLAFLQQDTPDIAAWAGLVQLIVSATLLGAVFISLGLTASSFSRQRGAAAGVAVSLWLLFVIVFDLALLGGLVAGLDSILPENSLPYLLLSNPADAFRILNMDSVSGSGLVSGIAEVSANASLAPALLWASLFLWIFIPLSVAILRFKKRDI